MRALSPKYVPREWMLVDAYTAAYDGDYGLVHELYVTQSCSFGCNPPRDSPFASWHPCACMLLLAASTSANWCPIVH
jgi:uncharacterized protein YdiU (UPF0061 family)